MDRIASSPVRAREWISQAASVVALAAGAYYIVWRLVATLNREALWLAIPLWGAEAYGLAAAAMFFFTVWRLTRRQAPPAPPGLSVDVFIPTGDEPVWLVRRAVLGARAIRYPHQTILLDQGARPEIARLAEELGVRYVAFPGIGWSKAQALNQALRGSAAEFVAVFDADHVPLPEFLDQTLGYFEHPRVAFVQTPYDFYNVDSYQHRYDVEARKSWHDQVLFFRVIQPGKDRFNAAVFSGSCAVFRRGALEDVGGFATETQAEDLHTSIRLHARAWRSVYHNEILAYGLAPATAGPYHAQRLRWGQGAMQVLRHENPLRLPGLTAAQRISYLASMTSYFDGFPKAVFYAAPAVFLITGILPVSAPAAPFLLRFGLTYGLLLGAYKLAARGHGMALYNEHYNMVRFYTYIKSTVDLLVRRDRPVLREVESDAPPWRVLIPVWLVFLTNDLGVYLGTVRFAGGLEPNAPAYIATILWATLNIWLAIWAIWFTLKKVERRGLYRVPVAIPVRYASDEGDVGVGVLVDIHEEGAGLIVPKAPLEAARVWIQFLWFDDRIGMEGEVAFQRETANGTHVGLNLRGIHPEIRDFLATFVILFAQRKFLQEVGRPLGAVEWRLDRRRSRRWRWHLPIRIQLDGKEIWGVTQDVSRRGALVLFPTPLPAGVPLRLAAWTSPVAHEATV
ncbi:MAG: glycosyltransferase, partial [Armatimonadetes bacterium]|nr:glycosyltransferase [Armatimonadota bacterium]